MSGLKNTCNRDLKFIDKIRLKINVKIKLGQILGSTMIFYYVYKFMVLIGLLFKFFIIFKN